jgi:hypothetical protein
MLELSNLFYWFLRPSLVERKATHAPEAYLTSPTITLVTIHAKR